MRRLVEQAWFRRSIIGLIVLNAVILGVETYPQVMVHYSGPLHLANAIIVVVFVIELVLRLYA